MARKHPIEPTAQGPRPGRRRRFSTDDKRRILAEASAPGQSVSAVGRRYGLSASLLFRWRRSLDGPRPPRRERTEPALRAELRRLREEIRQLERLLGKKTLEVERLRTALDAANKGIPVSEGSWRVAPDPTS